MSTLKNILAVIGAIYALLAVLATFDLIDVHTCVSAAGKCASYERAK